MPIFMVKEVLGCILTFADCKLHLPYILQTLLSGLSLTHTMFLNALIPLPLPFALTG